MKGISTLLGKPHVVTTMGTACSGFVVCCENETQQLLMRLQFCTGGTLCLNENVVFLQSTSHVRMQSYAVRNSVVQF